MAFSDTGSPTKEEAMFTCGEVGEWAGTKDLNCTCESCNYANEGMDGTPKNIKSYLLLFPKKGTHRRLSLRNTNGL